MRSTPWLLLIALVACDEGSPVSPAPSAPPTTTTSASAVMHPMEAPPPVRQRPAPIDSATIATHTGGATRLRIWELDRRADAGPNLASVLVTDAKLVAGMRDAIGVDQKPTAVDRCERCRAPIRIVFESPLGLDQGAVDMGCGGAEKGRGRFWLPASSTCAEIAIRDADALARLVEEAKKQPAKESMQGLP